MPNASFSGLSQHIEIRSYSQGALFGWGALAPTALGTVRVIARQGYPSGMLDFLVGRIEIYGRGLDGPLTDEQVVQWYRDTHGLRWQLYCAERPCADVVHLPLPGDSTICRWAQTAPDVAAFHAAWEVAQTLQDPSEPGTPWLGTPLKPQKVSTATLPEPVHLKPKEGLWSLVVTLPPGWRGSQPWQVGCALLGTRADEAV